MARIRTRRPKNREVENEMVRPPREPGAPPRPETEPPGARWSQESGKTLTDPGSGEPHPDRKPPA